MSKTFLKIKIMSLASEARIIRHEAHRWPRRSDLCLGLQAHRRFVVRPEARAAQLAYGFLRGKTYASMEAAPHDPPLWGRVLTLINKYGTKLVSKEMLQAWAEAAPPLAATA